MGPNASQRMRLHSLVTLEAVPRDDQGSGLVPMIARVTPVVKARSEMIRFTDSPAGTQRSELLILRVEGALISHERPSSLLPWPTMTGFLR